MNNSMDSLYSFFSLPFPPLLLSLMRALYCNINIYESHSTLSLTTLHPRPPRVPPHSPSLPPSLTPSLHPSLIVLSPPTPPPPPLSASPSKTEAPQQRLWIHMWVSPCHFFFFFAWQPQYVRVRTWHWPCVWICSVQHIRLLGSLHWLLRSNLFIAATLWSHYSEAV